MNRSELLTGTGPSMTASAITMSAAQAERELLKLDEEIARREARASFLQYWPPP